MDQRFDFLQTSRKRIDANHSLAVSEVERVEGVAHDGQCRILVRSRDRVFKVEDDGIRLVDSGVEHESRFVAGQVES